jgi:hypothetical protein
MQADPSLVCFGLPQITIEIAGYYWQNRQSTTIQLKEENRSVTSTSLMQRVMYERCLQLE